MTPSIISESSSLSSELPQQESDGNRMSPSTISDTGDLLEGYSSNARADHKKYHTTEYRILNVAKSVAEGSKIFVTNLQPEQVETMNGIRSCCEWTAKESVAVKLEEWRTQGVKFKDVFAKMNAHTDSLLDAANTTQSVWRYLTGITTYYDFGCPSKEPPPPTKSKDRAGYVHGRIAYGIFKLTSKLCKYFDVAALALFTVLEVGNVKTAYIDRAADDDFFYDGLIALVDLLWRRLAYEHEVTTPGKLPMINPTALYSLYTDNNYEDMCTDLNLQPFVEAPAKFFFEHPTSEILHAISKRSGSIAKCSAVHNVSIDQEEFRDDCESLSTDKSKEFILLYASRLAKYITDEERENRAKRYESKQQKNVEIALRILRGTASQEDLATASMEVVLIVVDILLDQCPITKERFKQKQPPKKRKAMNRPSKRAVKRRQMMENASNDDTSNDSNNVSGIQHEPQQPSWCHQGIPQNDTLQALSGTTGYKNDALDSAYNTMSPEEQRNSASMSMLATNGFSGGWVPSSNIMTNEPRPPNDLQNPATGIIGGLDRPSDDGALFGDFDVSEVDTGLPDMEWEGWEQMFRWNEADADMGLPLIYQPYTTTSLYSSS